MSARTTILEAARELASSEGPMALTIDRVIARAQVSKGGFFYHFASKDEMVTALAYEEAEIYEARVREHTRAGARTHEAHLRASFDVLRHNRGLMAVLMAAVALDRRIATFLSDIISGWTDRMVADGLSLHQAVGIRLLIDGLFMSSLLHEGPLPEAEFEIATRLADTLVNGTPLDAQHEEAAS